MKANEILFLNLLRNGPRFAVPIYQRKYSWGEIECKQLWNDIIKAGEDKSSESYFIGTIVYIQDHSTVSWAEPLMLIDGQQRITTISLLLAALAKYLETNSIDEDFDSIKILQYYIVHSIERGEKHYRFLPSKEDKDTYKTLINSIENKIQIKTEDGTNVYENFSFFWEKIHKCNEELPSLINGLKKLIAVDVSLERGRDNPQRIFESLNSTGRELTQFDLIRNYILMDLTEQDQNRLFNSYWGPIEEIFTNAQESNHMDDFFSNFLIIKTRNKSKKTEVYEKFKDFCKILKDEKETILKEIYTYAKYYQNVYGGTEKDKELKHRFKRLVKLKTNACQPLILYLYSMLDKGTIDIKTYCCILNYMESYIFRRQICEISSKRLSGIFNKVLYHLMAITPNSSVEFKNHFVSALFNMDGNPNDINDESFIRKLSKKNIYKMQNCFYILESIETNDKKEKDMSEYQIEHILPQNPKLNKPWKNMVGKTKYSEVQKRLGDTIGNLTLTLYNSEYKDYAFEYKLNTASNKDGINVSISHSPLILNSYFNGQQKITQWREKEIIDRGMQLAKNSTKIWPFPAEEEMSHFSQDPSLEQQETTNNISKYPIFEEENNQNLYKKIRDAIVSVSENNIEEKFLKDRISFKYIKNLVDICPRNKRINIYVYLKFEEIDEKNRIYFRDVSTTGHPGEGESHLKIGIDDIDLEPKLLALKEVVKKSYKNQNS